MGTLHILKSRAQRHVNEGLLAAVSARCLWSATLVLVSRQALAFEDIQCQRRAVESEGPNSSQDALACLSEPFSAGCGWKRTFSSPEKWPVIWKMKVTVAYSPYKGPWHPGGNRCLSQRPKEAEKVRDARPSGAPHQEGPLLCLRAGHIYYQPGDPWNLLKKECCCKENVNPCAGCALWLAVFV